VIYLKKYQKEIKNNMDAKRNQNSIKGLTNDQKEILMAPVFIVGSPRSGTTWLQKMMLENKNIAGGQESEFFLAFNAAINSVKNEYVNPRQVGLSTYWEKGDFYDLLREIWMSTFRDTVSNKPSAKYLLEKTPTHGLHMSEISSVLPKSKFIHIIRDSRSVVASLLAANKGWGWQWAPSSAKTAAIEWWRCVKKAKEIVKTNSKVQYLEVHYEDLLINPVEEIKKIYRFIGITSSASEIEESINAQEIRKQQKCKGTGFRTTLGVELKEPDGFIRKGQSDSWKKDLTIFQKLTVWRYTRKLMRECGYNWSGRIKG